MGLLDVSSLGNVLKQKYGTETAWERIVMELVAAYEATTKHGIQRENFKHSVDGYQCQTWAFERERRGYRRESFR